MGGAEGRETVFSIKSPGLCFSIIKGFADRGKTPLLGSDGNYYGMTSAEGTVVTIADGRGVVTGSYKYEGLGKNVLETQATQLKPGFYFIRIQTDKGTKMLKFLKS